jgi:hypothetical protein
MEHFFELSHRTAAASRTSTSTTEKIKQNGFAAKDTAKERYRSHCKSD